MHIHSYRWLMLSGLALLGCTGEAEWTLEQSPTTSPGPAAVAPPVEERARMTSFQGLSSGLPANAVPAGMAHLDGTVYLVVDGALFSLASGAKEWTAVMLPLVGAEKVTTVTKVDLSLFITTPEGLVRKIRDLLDRQPSPSL